MSTLLHDGAQLWHALGWTMIHFLWTGTALWLVLVLLRRALQRRSPQVRYAASVLALGACTLLAIGLAARITVHGGLLHSTPAAYLRDIPEPVRTADSHTPEIAEFYRQLLAAAPAETAATEDRAGRLAAFAPFVHTAAQWLPWLWLCGSPLIAALFGTGLIGTVRLRLGSRPAADAALLEMLARLQRALGISRLVTLAISSQVASPLVIGVVRPMIVLPPAMLTGLAPDQMEMVLLHELAHIRRWDNLFNLLQRVIEAVLFYHPAVWWTSRWVRLEREHCCDAVVLAEGRDPQSYAETLASLALPELSPQYALAAMANHQLVSRIRHILNVEEQGMRLTRSPFAWSGILLLAVGGALTFGHLAGAQDRPVDVPRTDDSAAAPEDAAAEEVRSLELLLSQIRSNPVTDESGRVRWVQAIDAAMSYPITDVEGTLLLDTPAWSPLQATGAPNVGQAGDNGLAWASLTEDGKAEWLELSWEQPVRAAALLVYESFNPGALIQVRVNGDDIQETTILDGADPVNVREGKGVAIVPVTVDAAIKYVTLEFDSPAFTGWNEIDAVGLVDLATGQVHWATGAQASSTYADRMQLDHSDAVLSLELVHRANADQLQALCTQCHKDPHAANLVPEQCPELVRSLMILGGDRRQRIEALRQELQRLEQEDLAERRQQALRDADQRIHDQQSHAEAEILRLQELLQARQQEEQAATQQQQAEQEEMRLQYLLKLREAEGISEAQAEAEIARLQELLQARQREADQQEAAAAEAERAAAQEKALLMKLYELQQQGAAPIEGLTNPDASEGATDPGRLLEQLQRTVQEQQQAIDRLTRVLETLQLQLRGQAPTNESQPPGSSGADAGTNDPTGAYIRTRVGGDGLILTETADVDDATFLRRVWLDLVGLPPEPAEVLKFLNDPSETKRQDLIDTLLKRNAAGDPAAQPAADPNLQAY